MRLQDLIRNQGNHLQSVSWDLILDLMDKVVIYSKPVAGVTEGEFQYMKVSKAVNECLDVIQRTIDDGGFTGSFERFYTVVDTSAKFRPVSYLHNLNLVFFFLIFEFSHWLWFYAGTFCGKIASVQSGQTPASD